LIPIQKVKTLVVMARPKLMGYSKRKNSTDLYRID